MSKYTLGNKLNRKLESHLKIVGEQIRLARLRRDLTLDIVAQRCTTSVVTLSKVEKGVSTVSIGTYLRALYALGLEDDILLLAQNDKLGQNLIDAKLKRKRASKNE